METSKKQDVLFRDLGRIEYQDAWDYQEKLLKENVAVKTEIRNRQSAIGSPSTGEPVPTGREGWGEAR